MRQLDLVVIEEEDTVTSIEEKTAEATSNTASSTGDYEA